MKKNNLITILLSIFTFVILIFQTTVSVQAQQCRVYNLTEQGLPAVVSCMTIDHNGAIWMGTNNGIVKFKNDHWSFYNNANFGLTGAMITIGDIAVDSYNNIWLAVTDESMEFPPSGMRPHLIKFNTTTEEFSVYSLEDFEIPCNNSFMHRIAIDEHNHKWCGIVRFTDTCFLKFDDTHWTVFPEFSQGNPNDYPLDIVIDNEGNKWIASFVGITKFDDHTFTLFNSSQSLGLAIEQNGTKWATTTNGLLRLNEEGCYMYDDSNSPLPDFLSLSLSSTITIDHDNNKWFSAQEYGLVKFNSENDEWTFFNTENTDLPSNDLETFILDSCGNIWCTAVGFLIEFNENGIIDSCASNVVKEIQHNPFIIAPNPAKNECTISGFHIDKIQLFNSLGKKVFEKDVNKDMMILNTTPFENGFYIVKIFTYQEQVYEQKIIINH